MIDTNAMTSDKRWKELFSRKERRDMLRKANEYNRQEMNRKALTRDVNTGDFYNPASIDVAPGQEKALDFVKEDIKTGLHEISRHPQRDYIQEAKNIEAREERIKAQEMAFPDIAEDIRILQNSGFRDKTDKELMGLQELKRNHPKVYEATKNISSALTKTLATTASIAPAFLKSASYGLIDWTTESPQYNENASKAVGDMIGGIVGSLVGLGAIGGVTRGLKIAPSLAIPALAKLKDVNTFGKYLASSSDNVALFFTDTALRDTIGVMTGDIQNYTMADALKHLGMSVATGAAFGGVGVMKGGMLAQVPSAGAVGFLTTIAEGGDVREAGMNAVVFGLLHFMSSPAKESDKRIAINEAKKTLTEILEARGIDNPKARADAWVEKGLKISPFDPNQYQKQDEFIRMVNDLPKTFLELDFDSLQKQLPKEQLRLEYKEEPAPMLKTGDMTTGGGVAVESPRPKTAGERQAEEILRANKELRELKDKRAKEEITQPAKEYTGLKVDDKQPKPKKAKKNKKEGRDTIRAEIIRRGGIRTKEDIKKEIVKGGLSDEKAGVLAEFNDVRAEEMSKRTGKSKAEIIEQLAEVKKGGEGKYKDTFPQQSKGSISFDKYGKAIVKFFKGSDFSTGLHEMAHLWRRDMATFNDPLLKEAESLYGVKDGKWTIRQEEQFARDFEGYVREGKAPKKKLIPLFESMKKWLMDIYKTAKELRLKLNPEKRAFFDKMLGKAKKTPIIEQPKHAESHKVVHDKVTPKTQERVTPKIETPEEDVLKEERTPEEINQDAFMKAKVNDKEVSKNKELVDDLENVLKANGYSDEFVQATRRASEEAIRMAYATGDKQTIGKAEQLRFLQSKAGRILGYWGIAVKRMRDEFYNDVFTLFQRVYKKVPKTGQKISDAERTALNEFNAEIRKGMAKIRAKKISVEEMENIIRAAKRRAVYDFQKKFVEDVEKRFDKDRGLFKDNVKTEDPLTRFYRQFDNIRRGLLVTQPITTARNIVSNLGTMGLRALDDIWLGAIRKIRGEKNAFAEAKADITGIKEAIKQGGRAGFKLVVNLPKFVSMKLKKEDTTALMDKVVTSESAKKFTDEFNKVMGDNISKDVDRILGGKDVTLESAGELSGKVRSVVDFLNTLNYMQNRVLNRVVFQAEIEGKLDKLGKKSLKDLDDITREKVVNESMKEALQRSFQYTPTSGAGKAIIDFWHRAPIMTLINPFIRFQVNAIKFLMDYNPLAMIKLAKLADKEFREKISKDKIEKINYERDISKAITGSFMLATALAIRESQKDKGGNWSDIIIEKNGNKYAIDLRSYAPLTHYLYFADNLLKKPEDRNWGDALNELVSINRMAGTAITLSDMIRQKDVEASLNGASKILGEYLGGFTVPIRFSKAIVETFSDEEAKGRQTRIEPRWRLIETPSRSAVPFLSQTLPERGSIYTGEVTTKPYSLYPLVRQLTGVNVKTVSDLELLLKKINFDMNGIYPRTGNRDIDNLATMEMGKIVAKMSPNIIRSVKRLDRSDIKNKTEIIDTLIKKQLQEAKRMGVRNAKSKYYKENPEEYKKMMESKK